MAIKSAVLGGVLSLLALALSGSHARAQGGPIAGGPAGQAPTTGTAAISGLVVDAGTKDPIPDVEVSLGGGRGGVSANVLTDSNGRFIFLDLPASATYRLTASKFGYFDGSYGDPSTRTSKPIVVVDGQWFPDARIELRRPSAISGTVVDESGDPVVGAYVRVLATLTVAGRPHLATGAVTQTDDRGTYRLSSLEAGTYLVSVPSVQSSVPADTTDNAVLNLTPQAIASSHVTGRELPAAVPAIDADETSRLVLEGYPTPPTGVGSGAAIYPATYYPSTTQIADALGIDLQPGDDRHGVDIQLRPVAAWRVSGTVQGTPAALAALTLRLLAAGCEELGPGSEAATALVRADGRFEFLNVPAGSYTIDARRSTFQYSVSGISGAAGGLPQTPAMPMSSGGGGTLFGGSPNASFAFRISNGDQQTWGREHIDVPDHDLGGVVVTMRPTMTISGMFVTEQSSSATPPRPLGGGIFVEPADGDASLGMQSTPPKPAGAGDPSFTISGLLPGRYVLQPLGGTVKSIVWNDKDYTNMPFDMSEGHDFTGVVITITDQTTTLTGTIQGVAAGQDTTVMAFPVEPAEWSDYGFQPRRLQSTLATNAASFRLTLPAGDYYVVAVPGAQQNAWTNPAFLAAAAHVATRVSLDWGDTKAVDLRVSDVGVARRP